VQLGLKDEVVLITGGTSGIGRAAALAFAREGAKVAIVGTNADRAAQVQSAAAAEYGAHIEVVAVTCDVADEQQVKSCVQQVQECLGPIAVLVNSAGIVSNQLIMRTSPADWSKVIDTNLKSVYNFSHFVVPQMLKSRRGAIVNISSVVALVGSAGQCAYAASKAGVIGLTKSLAREVASRGVRVNCVAPGWTDTPMTAGFDDKRRALAVAQVPLGRFGHSEEVAESILFLCSRAASYITGHTLVVDGGLAMS